MSSDASENLVIVTGASANHFRSLCQLLDTVRKYEPLSKCIVYDLGLSCDQRRTIAQSYCDEQFSLMKFDFDRYPTHLNISINAGEYAWKPAIIREASDGHNGIIVWCDSGNMLHEPLSLVREVLSETHIYSPTSAGVISTWTHRACLEFFGIGRGWEILDMPNRNGAFIAFDNRRPDVREFIETLFKCAMNKACIAPEGSNRSNHRQDQAVFSVLYYFYKLTRGIGGVDNYLQFSIHNDID